MSEITLYATPEDLARGAAELFADLARDAVAEHGRFTVALAGGGTPRPVYELLAGPEYAKRIPWAKAQVFFGDERCVPPTDERSNFSMAKKALLEHVPVPPENIHRIIGEEVPESAARAYEVDLRRLFKPGAPPAFDLILLGLGDNGHTVSLFPGMPGLHEQTRWVVPQYITAMDAWRVTVTVPLINAAHHVVFLVAGAGKSAILKQVLEGPYNPERLPAQLVKPETGVTHWLVDAAAGANLRSR